MFGYYAPLTPEYVAKEKQKLLEKIQVLQSRLKNGELSKVHEHRLKIKPFNTPLSTHSNQLQLL